MVRFPLGAWLAGHPRRPGLPSKNSGAAPGPAHDAEDGVTKEFRSIADLVPFFGRCTLVVEDKRDLPYFTRAACPKGRMKRHTKEHMEGPFLAILDVDKSPVPLLATSERLEILGVAHTAHTTYSHGRALQDLDPENCRFCDDPEREHCPGRHSYRVLTNLLAPTWGSLECLTRWTPGYFVLIGV